MDKTILNLLFNYKGQITYREFRAGTTILFMLVGTHLGLLLNSTLITAIAGKMGDAEWLSANVIYSQIMRNFTPNFVPAWFIVSYSSFVIAAKRIRELNRNRTITIISGIVNYLFFASFITLITIGMYQMELTEHKIYMSFITPGLICTVITFFIMGVVNLIFLCTRRESEQPYFSSKKRYLGVIDYTIKLGNLMGVTAIVISIVLIFLSLLDSLLLYSFILQIIVGLCICCLVPLFFYIKYSIYRLKDANIPVAWLIIVVPVYFVLFGFQIWSTLHVQQNNLTVYYYNTLFPIVTSFFIAAQYVLFLLPTRNDERRLDKE